jgi:hypothetical protein
MYLVVFLRACYRADGLMPMLNNNVVQKLCLLISFSLQNLFLRRPRIKDESQVTQLLISAPHHDIWECEVEFHAVLTSTLEVKGQLHIPAAFPPQTKPPAQTE